MTLIKRSKQFFYQLYSKYDRKFAVKYADSKLFKASQSFSKTIQRLFQFSEIQRLFKAGHEFKAGAGTLNQTRLQFTWLLTDKRTHSMCNISTVTIPAASLVQASCPPPRDIHMLLPNIALWATSALPVTTACSSSHSFLDISSPGCTINTTCPVHQ